MWSYADTEGTARPAATFFVDPAHIRAHKPQVSGPERILNLSPRSIERGDIV